MPSEAVAGGDCLDSRVAVIDCQIECVYIRTARTRLTVVVGIDARGGVGRAVPRVAITCGDGVD